MRTFRRLGILMALCVLVVGLSVTAPPASAAIDYKHCSTGPDLTGKLRAHRASCRTARRVANGYFTHTDPGQHVGRARVYGYRCRGRFRADAFRIKCYRRIPGTRRYRRIRFVGVGG